MKIIWTSLLFLLLFIELQQLSACNDCAQHEVKSNIESWGFFSSYYPVLYKYLTCTCNSSPFNIFSLDSMSVEASIVIFSNSTIPVIPLGAFSLNKHFEKIFLNNSHVKEMELGAFNGLTNLKELHLEDNQLRDIKEGTLTTLSNLEILNISNNKIEILEDKWFLGLSNLKELYLSQNMIKSISANAFYGLLQGMHILDLSHNQLKEIDSSLLDNILSKFVVLHNIQIGEIDENQNLTKLDLSYNHINHPITFLNFSHLNELNLNNNNIDEILNLDYVQNLQALNLGCNNFTNVTNVPSTVKYLSVKSNKFHNVEFLIKNLVNLRTLDLSNIDFKKLDHALFKNLPALNNLYLQNNELSDIPIGTFQNLGELMVLNLSSNVLTEFDYGTFAGLTNLTVLDVSNNSLYSLEESSLHILKNLRNLNIASNNLIDLDTQELLNFNKNLHSISLNGNQWNCKSLLKTCLALLNSNVTILDGFTPENVRQVYGISCSINENLDVAYTINVNSENGKFGLKEFNSLLQSKFYSTSFYKKYFQNYTTEIIQNRLPSNNSKNFKNTHFFKYFNYDFVPANFFNFGPNKRNLTNLYLVEDFKNSKMPLPYVSTTGVNHDLIKQSKISNYETNRNVLQQNTFIVLTSFIIIGLLVLNLTIIIYKKVPKPFTILDV